MCIRDRDGDVYAWGYNAHGQLGIGNANNQNTPQKITTFDKNVKSIQATCPRYTHVVALTTDNKLYTWGYNGYGQLGSGNTSDAYSPVERTISGQVAWIDFTFLSKVVIFCGVF